MKVSQSDKEKLIAIIKHRHIYNISFGWEMNKGLYLPDNLDNLIDTYGTSSILSLENANKNWKHINDINRVIFNAVYSLESYESDIRINQILIDFINEHELENIICFSNDDAVGSYHEVGFDSLEDNLYKPFNLQIVFDVFGKEEKC